MPKTNWIEWTVVMAVGIAIIILVLIFTPRTVDREDQERLIEDMTGEEVELNQVPPDLNYEAPDPCGLDVVICPDEPRSPVKQAYLPLHEDITVA